MQASRRRRTTMSNVLYCEPAQKAEAYYLPQFQTLESHLSYINGSLGGNHSFQTYRDRYCMLEASSATGSNAVYHSPSTASFSSNGSTTCNQESQRYLSDVRQSPETTNYGSPISGSCITDDVTDFMHKLKELETAMLGPDADFQDSYDNSLASSIASSEIDSWRQMMLAIPRQDLKQVLIACAKAVSDGELVTAQVLISELRQMVSVSGEPIQRLGAYILEGLVARLGASGSSICKSLRCKEPASFELLSYMHVLYEICPYFKFGYMSANGAIAEAMKDENRVHIIDFQIAQGSQWVPMIQAFAARPGGPPHIRITGIDDSTSAYARGGGLDIVGKRLSKLAKTFKVPFEFHPAAMSGSDVQLKNLGIQPGEALAVNFAFTLHHMPDESVSTENHRDRLLRMVKNLNPKVVTLVEQESNTNTAAFFPRFLETLDYYSALAFSSTVSPKHCRLSSAASSSSSFPKFQIPLKLNKITPCHSSSSKFPPSIVCVLTEKQAMAAQAVDEPTAIQRPDSFGRFGKFGGKYVPETLMHALDELETAFKSLATDEAFQKELDGILRDYVGRESPLYFAERLTEHYKRSNGEGPLIYLKREDLNHTGAHKINNAVAQALLAKRLGKKRIIAETGAGQHGVATATVCARFGLECIIYMGAQDMERQALNVFRMRLLGAEVRAVHSGTATLKDATSEAIRDWVTNVETTHYILGSVAGPHPYPMMVRDFHAVIGKETRKQALEKWGGKPDVLVACIGGGSNAMGLFHEFVDDEDVRLIGVEAAGFGVDSGKHAATLTKGEVGVLHGAMSYLLQDEDGQIVEPHSISAGLDYPGVGPEHSFLKDLGRAEYYSITDDEALEAFKRLSRLEGIIPALETSHALAYLEKLCPTLPNGTRVVLNCSGRGDKDVQTAIKYLKV